MTSFYYSVDDQVIYFENPEGEQVATLNFSGDELTFTGNMDEAALAFFNFLKARWPERFESDAP